MAPNCKICGIVKTTENCGVQTVSGKQYWQGYCKVCMTNYGNIKRNANGLFEYTIYVFRDTGATVTYVGATGQYHKRIMNHRSAGTIHPNEVAYILETKETLTKEEGTAWAKLREDHYMAEYADTIRNQLASAVYVANRRVHGDTSTDSD